MFPNKSNRPVDCGNLPYENKDYALNRKTIGEAIDAILRAGAVPVLLGG
ncbi:hypothetical protein EKH55_5635 (plasmid) [Sinorhizobium alkalisoli]|nr:hypothetical protein EKH55_5635 [Sinorhizobium alkalisoli]